MALAPLIVGCVAAGPRARCPSGPGGARGPLASLSWMAGCWGATKGQVEMVECWLCPRSGLMVGVHRDLFASGRTFFEYLRIERRGPAVIYLASPRGAPATPFRLVRSGPRRAVFANPSHDFPQRIIYWRGSDGALHARIEGPKAGRTIARSWVWRRRNGFR